MVVVSFSSRESAWREYCPPSNGPPRAAGVCKLPPLTDDKSAIESTSCIYIYIMAANQNLTNDNYEHSNNNNNNNNELPAFTGPRY